MSGRVLGLTFLFGALVTIPALALNQIGKLTLSGLLGESEISRLLLFVLIVGPVEEGLKLIAVYFYAYRRPEFDESLDGVVYGASAALGFAAIENVFYLAQNNPMLV
ncbi:MAG: PrsW family glutamic-type intramembrane protease, partial [Blastocatellia bacterium]